MYCTVTNYYLTTMPLKRSQVSSTVIDAPELSSMEYQDLKPFVLVDLPEYQTALGTSALSLPRLVRREILDEILEDASKTLTEFTALNEEEQFLLLYAS